MLRNIEAINRRKKNSVYYFIYFILKNDPKKLPWCQSHFLCYVNQLVSLCGTKNVHPWRFQTWPTIFTNGPQVMTVMTIHALVMICFSRVWKEEARKKDRKEGKKYRKSQRNGETMKYSKKKLAKKFRLLMVCMDNGYYVISSVLSP